MMKRLKSNGLATSTKDYHAKLVIHGIPRMKDNEIKALGEWLCELGKWAKKVVKDKDRRYAFSQVYTSRLMK